MVAAPPRPTTSTAAAMLDMALALTTRGFYIIPLCWPDAEGNCACLKSHTGHNSGKAPLTPKGINDSSNQTGQVWEWWHQWPQANIGIDLDKSGILAIAPDSVEWHTRFIALGLPPTATVQSGGGPGHFHFYYKRPDGCPLININLPDAYDLQPRGYVVAAGSLHQSGKNYQWVGDFQWRDIADLPSAPIWAIDMIQERWAESQAVADVEISEADELPAGFTPKGTLADWWSGQASVKFPSGDIDRSKTLFTLGLKLAQSGMSAGQIVAALRDRDAALGYDKYWKRPDGGLKELTNIAAKATTNGQRLEDYPADATEELTFDEMEATLGQGLPAYLFNPGIEASPATKRAAIRARVSNKVKGNPGYPLYLIRHTPSKTSQELGLDGPEGLELEPDGPELLELEANLDAHALVLPDRDPEAQQREARWLISCAQFEKPTGVKPRTVAAVMYSEQQGQALVADLYSGTWLNEANRVYNRRKAYFHLMPRLKEAGQLYEGRIPGRVNPNEDEMEVEKNAIRALKTRVTRAGGELMVFNTIGELAGYTCVTDVPLEDYAPVDDLRMTVVTALKRVKPPANRHEGDKHRFQPFWGTALWKFGLAASPDVSGGEYELIGKLPYDKQRKTSSADWPVLEANLQESMILYEFVEPWFKGQENNGIVAKFSDKDAALNFFVSLGYAALKKVGAAPGSAEVLV